MVNMTYNKEYLVSQLPHLIERIDKRIMPVNVTRCFVNKAPDKSFSRVYIKLSNMPYSGSYYFDVCEKGTMWNPLLIPSLMGCAFDWLKAFDQLRQIERVHKFKLELIEKVWAPSDGNFLLNE